MGPPMSSISLGLRACSRTVELPGTARTWEIKTSKMSNAGKLMPTLFISSPLAMVLSVVEAAQCIDVECPTWAKACQLETDQVEGEHGGRLLVFVLDSTGASMGAPLLQDVVSAGRGALKMRD